MHGVSPGTGGDAALLQGLHDGIARARRLVRIHVGNEGLPGMTTTLGLARQGEPVKVAEPLAIEGRRLGTFVDKTVQLVELHQPDRALKVGHPVVVSEQVELRQDVRPWAVMALLLGDRGAVIAHLVDALGKGIVVAGDHAALTGGDRLARVERKDRHIPKASGGTALVDGSGRAGRILDDMHVRGHGRPDRVDIGAQAEQMDRDDRLGLLHYFRGKRRRIHVEGRAVDIYEDRRCTAVEHDVGGGNPGEGGHDDLVARPDPQAGKG